MDDLTIKRDARLALKAHFGFDSFRAGQLPVIERIMLGKDIFVIMPTSAGKSLCFQLPILMKDGYGIVISPLISLMKDQVDKLAAKGIAAAQINSTLTESQHAKTMEDISSGRIKIVYIAPERLASSSFMNFIERVRPSMLVVDEAHGISEFGPSFRPSFLKIGDSMKRIPGIQIVALTATATPMARQEIISSLLRPGMELFVSGFARPNLAFKTISCSSDTGKHMLLKELVADRKPTIVYVNSRDLAEELGEELDCPCYHGKMSDVAKDAIEDKFIGGHCDLLIATCAFGMGVDRADVRRVIHFNMPGSLESYFQEAGRAGRDGLAADCILMHSPKDFVVQCHMIEDLYPCRDFVEKFYGELLDMARKAGTRELKMTNDEIMAGLPWSASESQIGSSLNLLEKNSYIHRIKPHQAPGTMVFLKDENAVLAEVKTRKSESQLKLVEVCSCLFRKDLRTGFNVSYDYLAINCGLEVKQVKKAINKLNGNLIAWTPPSYRRTIMILRPDSPHLTDIKWYEINEKRRQVMNRLSVMSDYINTNHCRQKHILEYFGEFQPDLKCGLCDKCKSNRF